MKKCIIQYPILALICILCLPLALAQETEPLVENSINPDSGFYGLDLAFERLQLALSPGAEAKAKLRLQFINERSEEMKAMAQKGLQEKIQTAKMNQEEHMAQIQSEIQQMTGEKAEEIESGLVRSRERLRYLSEQMPEVEGLKVALRVHEEVFERIQTRISQRRLCS